MRGGDRQKKGAGMTAHTTCIQLLSLVFSGTILLIIAWVNIGHPLYRRYRLRKPFRAYFKSLPQAKGLETTEHAVPANSNVEIDFRLKPTINYVQHELILIFEGDPDQKPLPKAVVNTFIQEGAARNQGPKTNPNHYIDYENSYHIRHQQVRTKGNTYAIGFLVETRGPGRFPVRFETLAEDGLGRSANDLTVVVG